MCIRCAVGLTHGFGRRRSLGQVKDAYQMTLEEKAANYEIQMRFFRRPLPVQR